jgi:hypothetical protein
MIYFDVESARSSETSAGFQRTTPSYIPEDRTLHCHRCDNIISCLTNIFLATLLIQIFKSEADILSSRSIIAPKSFTTLETDGSSSVTFPKAFSEGLKWQCSVSHVQIHYLV